MAKKRMGIAARIVLAAACVAAPVAAWGQVPNGRWACQVGGVDLDLTIAGEMATVALANGERFSLKLDPTRRRPLFTDGQVALRMSGGGPISTGSPEWVRNGSATTVERCRVTG